MGRKESNQTNKQNLLQNHMADDLGTWYVALGMWSLPNVFKNWSYVDHDLLSSKVKFAFYCI